MHFFGVKSYRHERKAKKYGSQAPGQTHKIGGHTSFIVFWRFIDSFLISYTLTLE